MFREKSSVALAALFVVVLVNFSDGQHTSKGFRDAGIVGDTSCTAIPDFLAFRQTELICEAKGISKLPTDIKYPSDPANPAFQECANAHDDSECAEFFRMGECESNPSWMWFNCYKACSRCGCENLYHNDTQCRIWESWGECNTNKDVMWTNCYRACSLCEGVTVTHKVRFEILQGGEPVGAFTIGVFGDVAPVTVRNFIALANHSYGFGFKGSIFHRVINNFVVQGGDITQGNGVGGRSIYGGMFKDEDFILKHIGKGWVNMANKGEDTNESQFSILTVKADWLNGKHVVFGKVLEGYDVVKLMEASATGAKDKPRLDLIVNDVEVTKINYRLEVEQKNVIDDGDSCKNIHLNQAQCAQWAEDGDCFKSLHTEWMWAKCYKSCSKCSTTFTARYPMPTSSATINSGNLHEEVEPTDPDCYNTHSDGRCESWAAGGECETNPAYMEEQCYKACSKCNNYLQERKTTLLCDSEWMILRCPPGHGILIQSAFYGRTDNKICPYSVSADTPTDCMSTDDLESKLKNSCNLWQECSGSFGPEYFGSDPCPGVPKYLKISYDCTDFDLMKVGVSPSEQQKRQLTQT